MSKKEYPEKLNAVEPQKEEKRKNYMFWFLIFSVFDYLHKLPPNTHRIKGY